MNVCFQCITPYQLFLAYTLSKLEYKDYNKTLIVKDSCDATMNLVNNIRKSGIWNEIIIIKNDINENIENQIKEIDINKFEIIHLFEIIYNYEGQYILKTASLHTKCILTEDGCSTYNLEELINFHDKYVEKEIFEGIDLRMLCKKIDEFYVLDKDMVINNLDIKIEEIRISELLNDCQRKNNYIKELNELFGYIPEDGYGDIIYFDQYLYGAQYVDFYYDKFIFENVLNLGNEYNLYCKPHTSFINERNYDEFNVKVLKNINVPWEVIYINEIFNKDQVEFNENRILISPIISTTLTNSIILGNKLGVKQNIISLHDILKKISKKVQDNDVSENLLMRLSIKTNFKVYNPKSFFELENWSRACIKNERYNTVINNTDIYENEFFKQIYVENWQSIISPRRDSLIYKNCGDGFNFEKPDSIKKVDISKEKISIKFNFENNLEDVSQVFCVLASQVSLEAKILEVNYIDINRQLHKIPLNSITYNGEINEYGYICFYGLVPWIQFDVEDIIKECVILIEWKYNKSYTKIFNNVEKEKKILIEERNFLVEQNKRSVSNYKLLTKLINGELDIYALNTNYRNIAIYGYGEIGKILYKKLKKKSINIVLFIDNYIKKDEKVNIPIIKANEIQNYKEIDLIIITPIFYYNSVINELDFNGKIISLEDIIKIK